MKTKILTLALLLLAIIKTNAQCTGNVLIPNTTFKTYLLDNTAINTIDDGQISCAEAAAFTGEINVSGLGITDLTGIEAFVYIQRLDCSVNNLTNLDISNNLFLTHLYCNDNALISLDVSNNIVLSALVCYSNQLQSLKLTTNLVTTLSDFTNNPNLTCIEVDNVSYANSFWVNLKDPIASYSIDCMNSVVLNTTSTNGNIMTDIPAVNGTYDLGTEIDLMATPNVGYEFVGWTGDITSMNNPLTTTMDWDKNLVANFSLIKYNLTTSAMNGTITTDFPSTSVTYTEGTIMNLTATPNTGYEFTGWTGDVISMDNPLRVTMDATKNIVANFSTTLGVDEVFTKTVSIYPNPATTNITVNLLEALQKVEIYTLLGNKVHTSNSTKVSIAHLSEGIYLVKITTESGKVAVKKIIKK